MSKPIEHRHEYPRGKLPVMKHRQLHLVQTVHLSYIEINIIPKQTNII
jgi:hypothetical protein